MLTKRQILGILIKQSGMTQKTKRYAPVAQLDRVFGYEPKGRGFESLPACQKKTIAEAIVFFNDIRSLWNGWYTFGMISLCERWYMPSAYEGTDIISYLQSKYIIRQRRISCRVSDISLKSTELRKYRGRFSVFPVPRKDRGRFSDWSVCDFAGRWKASSPTGYKKDRGQFCVLIENHVKMRQ